MPAARPACPPGRLSLNPGLEQVTVSFRHAVPPPVAVLHVIFSYALRPGLSGFYRSNYTLPDGGEGVLATTQFEATAARTAFPCFDEPALKVRATAGAATVLWEGAVGETLAPAACECLCQRRSSV